jgi:hypothetical protein
MRTKILGLAVGSLFFMSFSAAQAEVCDLKYTMKGWAAFYKTSKGTGTVTCPSGKSAIIALSFPGECSGLRTFWCPAAFDRFNKPGIAIHHERATINVLYFCDSANLSFAISALCHFLLHRLKFVT